PHSTFTFTAPASSALSALSLHDALPISVARRIALGDADPAARRTTGESAPTDPADFIAEVLAESLPLPRARQRVVEEFERRYVRSEEHTSELQSRENLVCRLLLEKKKKQ